jgi:nucleoid-associated protein YgaU
MENVKTTKRFCLTALLVVMGLMITGCAKKPQSNVQMDTSELNAPAAAPMPEAAAPTNAAAPADAEPAPAPAPAYKPAPLNPDAEKTRAARHIKKTEPATLTDAMDAPQKPAYTKVVKYYTVRRDDTFWSISRRAYGSGKYWKQIQEANPEVSAERLPVGQKIVLPEIDK